MFPSSPPSIPDDGGEDVSETLAFCTELTQLVAQEDFITYSCHESFKSYLKEII
jgi:hypothetical protein